MISIYDIQSWSDVAAFLIWTLAVCAIAKALFGSFLAAELQYRLSLRDAPRRQRANQLSWEVNNRSRWSENAARSSPHAAKVPLSDDELQVRRNELQGLTRSTLGVRASRYFMNCFACQAFWTAAAVCFFTARTDDVLAIVFTSCAYSGSSVLLGSAVARVTDFARPRGTGESGRCRSCGDSRS